MVKGDLFFKIIFLGAIISFFVGIVLLAVFINNKNMPELTEGEISPKFCEEKCERYDVLSSNNNSQYNFIRCECLVGIQIDASPYSGAKTKTEIEVYYFDSNSFGELTKEEVIERISTFS